MNVGENMENQEEGLLDRLWREVGCTSLSDLRLDPKYRETVRRALSGIPEDAFSRRQWEDALAYLLQQPPEKPQSLTPRQYLLRALEGERKDPPLDI